MSEKLKTRMYLVELINNTDQQDNESVKVRAIGKKDAREIVEAKRGLGLSTSRWRVGAIVAARGNTNKKDQELASRLRDICAGDA